ncbi:hypothetical protein LUZ60_001717 [Juncus effusus]|nr:hypothetical protein LUZ60_001717 [Juncus effusus]
MDVQSRKILTQKYTIYSTINSFSPAPSPSLLKPTDVPNEIPIQVQPNSPLNSFNVDVIMVLSILFCGVICALLVNAIVRCILRLTSRTCYYQDSPDPSAQDQANTRAQVRRKEVLWALPTTIYSSKVELAGSRPECTICLSEFTHGEHIRILPACKHGFHMRCIDTWLSKQSTCPTCRQCLFGTCLRVVHVGPVIVQVQSMSLQEPESEEVTTPDRE